MSQREILFRAKTWTGDEWVEGYYFGSKIPAIMPISDADGSGTRAIKLSTLCQFTGLYDKNGEQIWEGDKLSVINPGGDEDQECIVNYDTTVGGYVYESFDGFGDFDLTTIGWAQSLGYDFTRLGSVHDGEGTE